MSEPQPPISLSSWDGDKECPECKGEQYVTYQDNDGEGNESLVLEPCLKCSGTGSVERMPVDTSDSDFERAREEQAE